MVDFERWREVDALTVRQAAHLWMGIEPSLNKWQLTPEQSAAVAPAIQMLTAAIIGGKLPANASANPLSNIGDHDQSLVTRAELISFASGTRERPAFLFEHEASATPAESGSSHPSTDGQTPPASRSNTLRDAAAWLAVEVGRRIQVNEPRDRDTMVLAARDTFPLTKEEARKLYSDLPEGLQGKPGPKPGKPRKPTGSGDNGPT